MTHPRMPLQKAIELLVPQRVRDDYLKEQQSVRSYESRSPSGVEPILLNLRETSSKATLHNCGVNPIP
jgi:hypothetical protein